MAKTEDPKQGSLVLPPTRNGRTPSGMKTAITGAGNRITRTHELGERVFLFIEGKVNKSGHEETDDGVIYVEGVKTVDLFELEDGPGKRLLSALRQAYRSEAGEDPLTLGDETAGEGLEVALDAAGVAILPAELAALRDDPSTALDDERFDHVVLVFEDGSRGLWPDDWAGTGQSRAPIGGTMRRPGSTTKGDVAQVVELLDATTGEQIDKWTRERELVEDCFLEEERLLSLELARLDEELRLLGVELEAERTAALEEFELLRAKADGDELDEAETERFVVLRDRFEAEAAADRETMVELGLAGPVEDPPEADKDLGDPDEPGAPFAGGTFVEDRPDLELEVDLSENDELHEGPADTEGLHLFDPHEVVEEADDGYGPDDCLFVDRDVADLKRELKSVNDRDEVLRYLACEEDGRGRGLKPRKGALEAIEKRAAELFVKDDGGAPDLEPDLEVPDDAGDEPIEEF